MPAISGHRLPMQAVLGPAAGETDTSIGIARGEAS